MIENYTRLSSRMFTATVVGKDKNGRKITEGRETYKTPSGVYEIKDWARLVEKAAEADGLLPLLEQIKRHVKEYAWMKNASDIKGSRRLFSRPLRMGAEKHQRTAGAHKSQRPAGALELGGIT